jgi:hypothetical protein
MCYVNIDNILGLAMNTNMSTYLCDHLSESESSLSSSVGGFVLVSRFRVVTFCCHIPLKYRCPIEKRDHIRPIYLVVKFSKLTIRTQNTEKP